MADKDEIPLDLAKQMLEREKELRLSDDTQAIMKSLEKEPFQMINGHMCGDWVDYVKLLQKQVLEEFGIEKTEMNLYRFQTLTVKYPELKDIPIQIKYNRAKNSILGEGEFEDLPLRTLDLEPVQLSELLEKGENRHTFVCTGSIT